MQHVRQFATRAPLKKLLHSSTRSIHWTYGFQSPSNNWTTLDYTANEQADLWGQILPTFIIASLQAEVHIRAQAVVPLA